MWAADLARALVAAAVATALPACVDDPAAAPAATPAPAPRLIAPRALPAIDGYHAAAAITGTPPATGRAMPGRIAAMDARRPVPRMLWTAAIAPPPASSSSLSARARIETAARWHLARYAPLYGLDEAALATVEVAHVHDLGHGAIVVDLHQRVDGLEVWRNELSVVMDRGLRVIALAGNLHAAARHRGLAPALVMPARDAVARAVVDTRGGPLPAAALVLALHDDGVEHGYQLVDGATLARSARARQVWFPLPDRLVAAWLVESTPADSSRSPAGFVHVIAGDDGRVLSRQSIDAAEAVTYRVWADGADHRPADGPTVDSTPHPTGVPNGISPGFVAPVDVVIDGFNHPPGGGAGDPWLPVNATETSGNNVDAYADLNFPDHFDASDVRATATAAHQFRRTYATNQGPMASSEQSKAAVTQLFYTNNWLHDYLYDSGFTEAAGNAQASNLGRGGLGNDVLLAEAQDFSGTDNANMTTPLDGRSPIMQMYVFSAAVDEAFMRDGTIDNHVVAHEWGHYLHHRLETCGATQCGAMSEGWGDFNALLMSMRQGDNLDGTYAMGIYVTKAFTVDHAYFGIRRFPYSVSFAKNALTFRHVSDAQALPATASNDNPGPHWEVHNAGEIWAAAMFEGLIAMLKDSQGGAPRFTFEQARRRMADYMVGGMIATPIEPTFTEQRDAILAVAAASDLQDFAVLAQAFARRGLGSGAISPPIESVDGHEVVEDFATGGVPTLQGVTVDEGNDACDDDGVLDPGEQGVVTVRVLNTGTATLAATTATVEATGAGASFPDGTTLHLPAIAPFQLVTATLPIALDAGLGSARRLAVSVTIDDPGAVHGDAASVVAAVNLDQHAATSASDDVEAPASAWTVDGEWARLESSPAQNVWHVTDYAGAADWRLVSPPLAVSPTVPLVLSFSHRYNLAVYDIYLIDGAVLEVSTDGGATWADASTYATMDYDDVVPVEALTELGNRLAWGGTSTGYPGFHTSTIDFGTSLAGQTIRLRFRMVTSGFFAGVGWELDDLAFAGLTTTPFPTIGDDAGVCLPGQRPIAAAGDDLIVTSGDEVHLDGSTSTDPDGSAVSYAWSQLSGPTVALDGASTATPSFLAPDVGSPRTVALQLVVTDEDDRSSAPDLIAITVRPVLELDAGIDATPDAAAEDPDGGGNPAQPDAGGGAGEPGGCGCQSGGAAPGLGLGLVALALRRRRARRYGASA